MTNEETIKELKHLYELFYEAEECSFNRINDTFMFKAKIIFGLKMFDVLAHAIKALENQERYKWHDLRKDPNDLPRTSNYVMICVKGFEGSSIGVFIAIRSKEDNFWMADNFSFNDDEVIAWKEIELFKRAN